MPGRTFSLVCGAVLVAAACAPPDAERAASIDEPVYGSELGDYVDTGIELVCHALTNGESAVNAVAGLACLGAAQYGKWCGLQSSECYPSQCNMGSWLPQIAGSFETGPIGSTISLIGTVAETAARTFDGAAGGPCSGEGLWCGLYFQNGQPDKCATDTGPGTISACLISKRCQFLGRTKLVGPGTGGVFTPQTCDIYPICKATATPAVPRWQPPSSDALPGRAPTAPLPPLGVCQPPDDPGPLITSCSYPFADTPAAELDRWSSGREQRRRQVITQLLSGIRAYRAGSLPATTTRSGMIDPLADPDREISDAALVELSAYAEFQGCKERGLLAGATWFAKLVSEAKDPADTSAGFSTAARLMARQDFLVLVRILAAIPNLEARLDHITSRAWCQPDGDAYLARIADHDAVLLRELGPVGFRILRGAFPDYKWFAVPAPGEPPPPADYCDREAACTKATPPDFELVVTPIGASHRASLAITTDPADLAGGLGTVAVDWGDGSTQTFAYGTGPSFTVAHPYPAAATYPVRARLTSDAGVSAERSTTVAVLGASPQPSPLRRSIRTLRIHGSAVVPSPAFAGQPPTGDVLLVEASAVLADGRSSVIGMQGVAFTKDAPRTRTVLGDRVGLPPIELPAQLSNLPFALRLRIRSAHASPHTGYRHFQIDAIELELHEAAGAQPAPREWVTVHPTPASTFLRPAGKPMQSVRMDLEGGLVMLPVDGTEVEVGLPLTCRDVPAGAPAPPSLGCRPARDAEGSVVEGPRFTSANGGCYDRDTMLAWSTANRQPRSWMDLAWSASTPGSAPADADDPYPGDQDPRTPHADTGAGGYCHDLVEGGHTDWRMPRVDELIAVMTKDLAWRSFPQLDGSFLSSTSVDPSYARKHGYAPLNYLYDHQFPTGGPLDTPSSFQIALKTTSDRFTLCVRKAPLPRHYCRGGVTGDGTFISAGGGCADTRGAAAGKRVWSQISTADVAQAQAAAYCTSLREADQADWRLPTRAELNTTIDNIGVKHFDRYFDTSLLGGGTYQSTGFWAADGRWPGTGAIGRVICVRLEAAPLVAEEPPAPTPVVTTEYGTCEARMTTR